MFAFEVSAAGACVVRRLRHPTHYGWAAARAARHCTTPTVIQRSAAAKRSPVDVDDPPRRPTGLPPPVVANPDLLSVGHLDFS